MPAKSYIELYKDKRGGFEISLHQATDKSFKVVYGEQVDFTPNYNDAASLLGFALLHALTLEGNLMLDTELD